MIGVMLGVASLVTMLTLIGGIDRYLNEKMGKWVGAVWFWKKWDPPAEEKLAWSRSPGLRLSDGTFLKENSSGIKDVPSQILRQGTVNIGNSSERAVLRGLDSLSIETSKDEIQISKGRWIGTQEHTLGLRNCVISWEIAESMVKELKLKNTVDLINKNIKFQTIQLVIIGIFNPVNKDQIFWELRRGIIVSITTMQKYVTGLDPDPGSLKVQVRDPENLKQQARSIANLLTQRHRGVEDFEYQTADWANKVTSMLNNISVIMGLVSILSLSVGGLSIMNVMLSSISERIREIGTRKALGAGNGQIFIQFVAETSTLCFTGGILGSIIGCTPLLFKKQIMQATDGVIEPTILPLHIFYTFLIIIGIGILFGLYPALKASKMNPIDALRYE
jgi:putative ABC transport system permease protein